MGPRNHLLIRADDALHQNNMFRGTHFPFSRKLAQIVHAFENDHEPDASLRQNIAIETRQRIEAGSIGQQTITADTLIQHADIMKPGSVESARQYVRPAIIAVRRCAVSIRNRVAKDDHGEAAARSHIDAGELIPMVYFPGARMPSMWASKAFRATARPRSSRSPLSLASLWV